MFYSRHSHSARATISADRGCACEHPTAPFARPVSVQAHRTEGVTGSEGREGANGVGGGIGVGAGTETVTESGVGTET